jgi:hypothetical protein
MQLAFLLGLHAVLEGGKAGGCRYDLGRMFVPRFLAKPVGAYGARDRAMPALRMKGLVELAGAIWVSLPGRLARGRSEDSGPRLSEALVQRGAEFGRIRGAGVPARSSMGRAGVGLLGWLALLFVVGGAFAGLGLAGIAEMEPRRLAYEQGKATRVVEQVAAGFRRGCLVRREATSRIDPKAVVAAVRLPFDPLGLRKVVQTARSGPSPILQPRG